MASEKAKLAGKKVLESLGKGKAPILGQVLREVGYADNTADTPQNVTNTKSYKDVVNPFIKKLEKERDRIVLEMSIKDLDTVQYHHLVSATDTLTKNIQLLSGGETERAGVTINVVKYGDNNTPSL
jgi:hypothetical protein